MRKKVCITTWGKPPRAVEVRYWGYPDKPPLELQSSVTKVNEK